MDRARILVTDDKENYTKLFVRLLEPAGHEVVTAIDGARALALIAASTFDVVVSDIRMPHADGLAVLHAAHARDPETEVVLMTGYATVAAAVAAMRDGAFDYLAKPFEPEEAQVVVERALERRRLRRQARSLRRQLAAAAPATGLVAKSRGMHAVATLVPRAAASDATVLITGESGTGKEVVARALHAQGPRAAAPFVALNCGAIPEALLESELFGHVRGSFTGATAERRGQFEEAEGGTLFLDEVGELPLAVQVKLNRVLQERTVRRVGASEERRVDVRVIAATNVDLVAAIAAGRFREDLYYRLNVLHVALPPLRERREDLPDLAGQLLAQLGANLEPRPDGFSVDALAALLAYPWPGNVRELKNAIERALAVSDGPRIELEALPDAVASHRRGRVTRSAELQLSYRDAVDIARDRASREYLIALMTEVQGNVTEAARRAGMERESLHRLLKRYGVRSDAFKR